MGSEYKSEGILTGSAFGAVLHDQTLENSLAINGVLFVNMR